MNSRTPETPPEGYYGRCRADEAAPGQRAKNERRSAEMDALDLRQADRAKLDAMEQRRLERTLDLIPPRRPPTRLHRAVEGFVWFAAAAVVLALFGLAWGILYGGTD